MAAVLTLALALAVAGSAAHATLVTYRAGGTYTLYDYGNSVTSISDSGSYQVAFTLNDSGPATFCHSDGCDYAALVSYEVSITSSAGNLAWSASGPAIDPTVQLTLFFADEDQTSDLRTSGSGGVPSLDGLAGGGAVPFTFHENPGPLASFALAPAVASLANLAAWGGAFSSLATWVDPQNPFATRAQLNGTLTSITVVPEPAAARLLGVTGLIAFFRMCAAPRHWRRVRTPR